jgi:hypothetical protein
MNLGIPGLPDGPLVSIFSMLMTMASHGVR